MIRQKSVLRSVLFLLLLSLGMKSITAQTPYRQYANDGVELNFFVIENVDFRACLLYNLTLDDRFVLIPEDENGILSLSSNDDLSREDFFDTFEDFYNNTFADFQLLSKQEITDLATMWKSQVDPRLYSSIMMDITLRRSRSGDNEQCMNAIAFCTSDVIDFESASTSQTANEPNMNDGCIGSSYNPSWYYMRIADSGPFTIHLEGHDPNSGVQRDIDFCLWGPYSQQQVESGYACSHLTADKIIDCSYSAAGVEDAYLGFQLPDHTSHHNSSLADENNGGTINYHVPQSGEYYLLMITNFSRQPCVIDFHKEEGSGAGTTDCSLLPAIVSNDGPYCVGETIHLHAEGSQQIEHVWTGPNNFSSRFPNPNIPNCTMNMAGPYICTLTHNGQTASDTTWVEIYPSPVASFTATNVCLGETTQFDASSSTMNPPQYNIASYTWDFGDGTTGSGVTPTHTYTQAGTYQVTLHLTSQDGHCTDEITQSVTVVTPGATEHHFVTICDDELPYSWNGVIFQEEGEQTITIQTEEGCQSTATLHLSVIHLDVHIEVQPDDEICEGDTVMLHATVDSAYFVSVGDILCTDGIIVKPYHFSASGKTPKGIVFYVDDSHTHGYAVSLTQSGPMKWSTQTTLRIRAYTHWRDAITDFNGYNNTQILRNGTTAAIYPAAWNVDFANGWYLPSAGQINLLYGELMDVNASLTLVGGALIVDPTGTYGINNGDVYLWSSTEYNNSQAMCIKIMDGLVKSVNKTTGDKYYVRSVINF